MFTTSAESASSVTLRDRLFGEEATTSPWIVFELLSSLGTASLISSFFGGAGFSTGLVFAITFFSPVAVFPTGFLGGALGAAVLSVPVEADGPVDTPSEADSEGFV